MKKYILIILLAVVAACNSDKKDDGLVITTNVEKPFVWENANIYFLLTDRFYNADTLNDINFNRKTSWF